MNWSSSNNMILHDCIVCGEAVCSSGIQYGQEVTWHCEYRAFDEAIYNSEALLDRKLEVCVNPARGMQPEVSGVRRNHDLWGHYRAPFILKGRWDDVEFRNRLRYDILDTEGENDHNKNTVLIFRICSVTERSQEVIRPLCSTYYLDFDFNFIYVPQLATKQTPESP
ncbi:uncharacterized protein MCYG_04299 [Microsporum canis CBS 113480]|uniref:Uncharacterized protein n=1 Tax=Arthroderma otae (strain ATCC MYA-4605 / CBS 113480) TaxID=554155 RepID=C5FPG4_ARTOC|nr:uncharacterized protein MCYG_04299 [Microsporum canis CBS 113480]EEQ31480.1 predicted protein [Microsporum canis CBS 113480]